MNRNDSSQADRHSLINPTRVAKLPELWKRIGPQNDNAKLGLRLMLHALASFVVAQRSYCLVSARTMTGICESYATASSWPLPAADVRRGHAQAVSAAGLSNEFGPRSNQLGLLP
jgi:hypothetical protein